jgi:hypothetical protein
MNPSASSSTCSEYRLLWIPNVYTGVHLERLTVLYCSEPALVHYGT